MKRRRKRGIYAVTAAAMLLAAWLITSCSNPTSHTPARPELPVAPEGYGLVRLSVPADPARTIIPDVPDFLSFQVHIREYTTSPAGLGALIHTFTHLNFGTSAGGVLDIFLPERPAGYTIVVEAFSDGSDSPGPVQGIPCDPVLTNRPGTRGDNLVARGRSGQVIVGTAPTTATINLHAIFTGEGSGIFDWDINMPAGDFGVGVTGASAIMTLRPRNSETILPFPRFRAPGDGPAAQPVPGGPGILNLVEPISNNNSSVTLPVGFYDVELTFTRPNYSTRQWFDVLHVAENMTSYWEPNVPDLNLERHLVTLVNYDGRTVTAANDGGPTVGQPRIMELHFTHGTTLFSNDLFRPAPVGPPPVLAGRFYPEPVYAGSPARIWRGWFTGPDPDGNLDHVEWDVNPSANFVDRIIRPIRLYGVWYPLTQVGTSVFFVPVSNRMPAVTEVEMYQGAFVALATGPSATAFLEFNIAAPTLPTTPPGANFGLATTWQTVAWRDEAGTIPLYDPGVDNRIRLDITDPLIFARYSQIGTHLISVTATTATPSLDPDVPVMPWSGQVRLIITATP